MSQYTSYYLYQKFEQRGEQDPIPVYPNIYSKTADGTMPLVVRKEFDVECGWHCNPPVYMWVDIPITEDYICGECDAEITHKWEDNGGYICEGVSKYHALQLYYRGSISEWEAVYPAIIKPGELIEEKSTDCGYVQPRMRATLADGTVKEVPYITGQYTEQTNHLYPYKVIGHGVPPSQIKSAEFFHGDEIRNDIFDGFSTLTSVTFNDYEEIWDGAFYGTGLKTVTGKISNIYGMAFASCKDLTSFVVTNERFLGNNGHIGSYIHGGSTIGMFANCTGLTEMDLSTIPIVEPYDSDTPAGEQVPGVGARYLFGGCTNLITAKISMSSPEAGYPVGNTIPNSCFERCQALTSVSVYCGWYYNTSGGKYAHSSVGIGKRAFFGCKNLTSIEFEYHPVEKAPSSSSWPFELNGDTFISINGIDEFAFYDCEKITTQEIENKLGIDGGTNSSSEGEWFEYWYNIGSFINCKSLTSIPRPQWYASGGTIYPLEGFDHRLISIGDYSFSGCTGIEEIEFDGYIESIGSHAFDGCTGLTQITVDRLAPPTLGYGAFDGSNCDIYVPCDAYEDYKTANSWKRYANRIRRISDDCTQFGKVRLIGEDEIFDVDCNESSVLTSGDTSGSTLDAVYTVKIGQCVTSIDSYAFRSSIYSTTVTIELPNTISQLPMYVFRGLTNLANIEIPDSVTSIGTRAFGSCSSLTELELPSGVTSIGCYAFEHCDSLSSFTILAATPPPICDDGIFTTGKIPIIYVPSESVAAYKAASGWRRYESWIHPIL